MKQRRQETCVDEQGASSKIWMEKKCLWNVEGGRQHLGGIEEGCQSMQGGAKGG